MGVSVPRDAGEMPHRVTILRRIDYPADNMAAVQVDEVIKANTPAKIEPVSGAEYRDGVQTGAQVNLRIWVRNDPGLTDAHSLQHGVLVREGDVYYRPVRVTQANGAPWFTILEVVELGTNYAEGQQASIVGGALDG